MDAFADKFSVPVLLSLQIVMLTGKFLFDLLKKKSQGTDRQLALISDQAKEFRFTLNQLQVEILEIRKVKTDLNNVAAIVRAAIGPEAWKEGATMVALDKSIRTSD